MRFAGGGRFLKFLGEALMPQGEGAARWVDAALRYGPDLGFAAYSAYAAPGGFNPLVGAEDFGISLLGSTAGALAGRGLGRTMARGLSAEKAAERMGQMQQIGDVVVSAPLQIAAPRPILNAAIEDAYKRPAAQDEQLQEAEQQKLNEQLWMALLTGGNLAGGLGPTAGGVLL